MTKNPEPLLDDVLGSYSWFMETECCSYSTNGRRYVLGYQEFIEENNTRNDATIDYTFVKTLPKKTKDNIYIILTLVMLESMLLIISKYNQINFLFELFMRTSNGLLIIIPPIILIYGLIVIINTVHTKQ